MKKKTMAFAMLLIMLLYCTAFVSFAGQTENHIPGLWVQDTSGWWWQNNDGTYPVNEWAWLDGNDDGVAECYYFDPDGYIFQSQSTPDGYSVNANGAWMINGTVQTKTIGTQTKITAGTGTSSSNTPEKQAVSSSTGSSAVSEHNASGVSGLVWVSATGSKYHSIPNCGKMNPQKVHQETIEQAQAHGLTQCSKCW